MALAKVGRRGSLVIPAEERRRAGIDEGDRVQVRFEGKGLIVVRKVPSLENVRKKLAGRLRPWNELEGRADELILQEAGRVKNRETMRKAAKSMDIARAGQALPKIGRELK